MLYFLVIFYNLHIPKLKLSVYIILYTPHRIISLNMLLTINEVILNIFSIYYL